MFCLLLFSTCENKSKLFVPERLLTEPEMIDIMTDVQIIEADLNYRKTQDRDQGATPVDYSRLTRSFYDQLFEHYGITDSIFEQNIRYYTERPATLEKIMDSVSQRLLKKQATSSTP